MASLGAIARDGIRADAAPRFGLRVPFRSRAARGGHRRVVPVVLRRGRLRSSPTWPTSGSGRCSSRCLLFTAYLSLRARASFNILRAAYPTERIEFLKIWGAYFAGYGFNAVIPARGGDVVRLFLTKTSVPNSSYPAVAASFVVELGFDVAMGSLILIYAFSQGVFPKPPDFAKLNAFDLSYLAQHPRFTLFLLTALALGGFVAFALLSARVKAFWERVRQGLTILQRPAPLPARGLRGPVRGLAVSLRRLLGAARGLQRRRLGRERAAGAGGERGLGGRAVHPAGRRRAAGAAGEGVRRQPRAAYSVGQQIAIGALTFGIGFAALVFIFRARSFKEVIALGREDRARETG